MKPIVVIAYDEASNTQTEQEVLSAVDATILHIRDLSTPEAIEMIGKADALMITVQEVTASLIAAMERCQIISRVGTGIDNIDVAAATECGIWVTNVPDYSVDEVSTHTVALLLAYARRLPHFLGLTKNGKWDSEPVHPILRIKGQRLGLLGFGQIGLAVAEKASGLGLALVAHDPYVDAETMSSIGVQSVDLETLFRTSDYVSLHTPLTRETFQIVNAETLSLMKPTAFLINTARGDLVDEDALLRAVQAGRLAGAALDVLSIEPPPPDHPLLHEERVMVTPHVGWYSETAQKDVRIRGAKEVVRVIRGEQPQSPVNQIDSVMT